MYLHIPTTRPPRDKPLNQICMKKFYTCLLLPLLACSAVFAQTIRPEFPFTDGVVLSIIKYGNAIYIGGRFSNVMYASGSSYPRKNLAAFDAITGAVLPWNPAEGNSIDVVKSLAAANTTIYVGGDITTRPEPMSSKIFAVNAITGAPTSWPMVTFTRSSIAKILATNSIVYVSGGIEVSNSIFQNIWAFDAISGQVIFTKRTAGSVSSLELKSNSLFAGGSFESIESQTRYYIGSVDAKNGNVLPWNPAADWDVRCLKLRENTLFAGGQFTGFGYHPTNGVTTRPPQPGTTTTPKNKVAALDVNTGAILPWDPKVEGNSVLSVDINSRSVYIGGTFNKVSGQTKNNLAMVDAITGIASSWDPNPNGSITSILADDSTVFVAGPFTSIAGQARSFFAALTPSESVPVITCPDNITVSNAPNTCGQTVSFAATATGSPTPTIIYHLGLKEISSPYDFPVGTSTVDVLAGNSFGASRCSFTVTVKDTEAPIIKNVSTNVDQLWPANKKMRDVQIGYTTSDNCPGEIAAQLSITSNETVTSEDWKIVDNHHIQLKADRSGSGDGRIYTITITAKDEYGNTSTRSVTVLVPHDQSKGMNLKDRQTSRGITSGLLIKAQSNPSRNYFVLLVQSDDRLQKINLNLYDANGRLLEIKNDVVAGEFQQMGRGLKNGIYILECTQGTVTKQIKLIKQ